MYFGVGCLACDKGLPVPQLLSLLVSQRGQCYCLSLFPRIESGRARVLGIPVWETLASWLWPLRLAFRTVPEAEHAKSERNRARREFKRASRSSQYAAEDSSSEELRRES